MLRAVYSDFYGGHAAYFYGRSRLRRAAVGASNRGFAVYRKAVKRHRKRIRKSQRIFSRNTASIRKTVCALVYQSGNLFLIFLCQNIVAAVLTVVALVAFLALEHTVFYVFEHCIHGEIIIREQRTVSIGKRIKIKYYVFRLHNLCGNAVLVNFDGIQAAFCRTVFCDRRGHVKRHRIFVILIERKIIRAQNFSVRKHKIKIIFKLVGKGALKNEFQRSRVVLGTVPCRYALNGRLVL